MPTTSTTKEEERTMNRVGGGGVAPRKRNDGFIHGKPVVPWFLAHLPTQFTRQSHKATDFIEGGRVTCPRARL